MPKAKATKAGKARGRPPQRVKTNATFEDATRAFLSKKKPPGGWPGSAKAAAEEE